MSDAFQKPFSSAPTGGPFAKKKRVIYKEAHEDADTDNERGSIHHTLGSGPNQAAPGNHKHNEYMLKPSTEMLTLTAGPNINLGTSWAVRLPGAVFVSLDLTTTAAIIAGHNLILLPADTVPVNTVFDEVVDCTATTIGVPVRVHINTDRTVKIQAAGVNGNLYRGSFLVPIVGG